MRTEPSVQGISSSRSPLRRWPQHARKCCHPGCDKQRRPGTNALYCLEHGTRDWYARRQRESGYARATPPRDVEEIRADLAAQLTAALHRFDSLIARDRPTDPLR